MGTGNKKKRLVKLIYSNEIPCEKLLLFIIKIYKENLKKM
jgi:hypothetical protein